MIHTMTDRQPTVTKKWPSRPAPSSASDQRPASPAQRILVADDSETMRTLMTDLLPAMGYAVITASDGHKAIEEFGRCEPHLVLLDIEMPGLDGCEVCRRIKSHPETRSTPVVLVSGHPDASDRAARAGADGFLPKPFLLDDLREWLRALLGPATVRAEGTR